MVKFNEMRSLEKMKEKCNGVFEKISGKLVKILFLIFIMIFSFCVLAEKVPDMKYVTSSIESLEKSQNRVLVFHIRYFFCQYTKRKYHYKY